MSLAETQELMATMKELMALLNGVEAKTEKLTKDLPRIKDAVSTFQQAERLALRYLSIARKMGLPEQVEQATQLITTLVVMMRMLQLSATMISGGGIGALIGIAGVISVTMTANDMLGYDGQRGFY